MTVIDVNTGKFTGSGGNLEETVTRNNLESAEEIVRQLRLRDIGGIIVIDFIDMVLESNRDLVLRRLTECLGRDRTRHQVAEVTSLGLVQMTRKRVGTGLLEAFSATCEHCRGRGVIVTTEPAAKAGGSNGNGGHQHQQTARPPKAEDKDASKDGKDKQPEQRRPTRAERRAKAERARAEAAEAAGAADVAEAVEAEETAEAVEVDAVEAVDAEPIEAEETAEAAETAEAVAEVVDAEVVEPEPVAAAEAPAEPIAEPVAEAERQPEPEQAAEPVAEALEPQVVNGHAKQAEIPAGLDDEVLVTSRRRPRRRSASRPAGPPVNAGQEG
jgi:ribonuclease E